MNDTAIRAPEPAPARCPRRAQRVASGASGAQGPWVGFADLHREPFRLFFPAATLAGLIGVALWPAMLLGWTENYPGPSHARLMVQGFFGGFILGFMGTAMPRLVGARPFSAWEAAALLTLFLGNVSANILGMNTLADWLFVGELVFLFSILRSRCHGGGESPPPSFILVGIGFASAVAGTALLLAGRFWELSQPLELLARLLSYHSFVLLCILGAGGFLLPRFLGLGVRRELPESTESSPQWKRAVRFAQAAGAFILLTYLSEAFGWSRVGGTARAIAVLAYLAYEMPLEKLRWNWRGIQWQLIVGLVFLPLGILAAGWISPMRLTFSHVELVGGFALITFGVATRVVFGHSGGSDKLDRFHPWLTLAALLMLLGLAARISGDFLPGIQMTHYLYGAGCWMAGTVVWAACVLRRVRHRDSET